MKFLKWVLGIKEYPDCIELIGYDFNYIKDKAVFMLSTFDYEVIKPMHSYYGFTWRIVLKEGSNTRRQHLDFNFKKIQVKDD